MYFRNFFCLLILCYFVISCCKETNNNSSNLAWSIEFSKGDSSHQIRTIIVEEDILIVVATAQNLGNGNESEPVVKAYNKSNGDLLWKWNDAYKIYGAKFNCIQLYAYSEVLAFCTSNLTYGINIKSGETIWHSKRDGLGTLGIRGLNKLIFREAHDIGNKQVSIEVCNINQGNWETIYSIDSKLNARIAASSILPFEEGGNLYACFLETEVYNNPNQQFSWLNLYNYSENKIEWRSDTIKNQRGLARTTPGLLPIYKNGRIFTAEDAIYSFDSKSGELIWSKYYGNNFSYSNLNVGEGMVYGHNESQFLVGLDTEFGSQRFKTTTGGSASNIEFFNGKVYVTAISTLESNRFMIFDGKSGEILNSISPPFLQEGSFHTQSFDKAICVDHETGKQYLSDGKHILCYKALE